MSNNNNCFNHTVYQAYNDRSLKYSFLGNGRVQFYCFKCASQWEDYQRFKRHCSVVHRYDYETQWPNAYPWNYSNPNSLYQQELRAIKEMITNAAAKRKAEASVGPNDMEPKTKNLKTIHGEVRDKVKNNAGEPSTSEGVNSYNDDYRAMVVKEGKKRKKALKKKD